MNPNILPNERDELEQHLHANLRPYAPEAPEALWNGIEPKLPVKRRRRRPVLWWWLGFAFVATLAAGTSFFYGKQHPEENVAVAPQQIPQMPPDEAATSLKTAAVSGSIKPENRNMTNLSGPGVLSGNLPATVQALPVKTAQILENDRDNSLQRHAFLSEKTNPVALSPLLLKPVASMQKMVPVSPQSGFRLKTTGAQPWSAGFAAGLVWIRHPDRTTDPHHSGALNFAEHGEGPAWGWQAGLQTHYSINAKWGVLTGFFHRTTTQASSHQATMRLLDGVCLNPNDPGPKEYEFEYNLQSSVNSTAVTVRIAQVDSLNHMPNDEPFTLSMRTTRRNTDWVLPLSVQRTFGAGPWQGFLQGGGMLALPAHTVVSVDHFTEACADLCFAGGRIPTLTLAERRSPTVSWLVGAGVSYRFAQRWVVSATPSVFGNKGQAGFNLLIAFGMKF